MGDYRNNPNMNTNYPKNAQRPGQAINRPGQGQSVPYGAPVNTAAPNRPSTTNPNRSSANANVSPRTSNRPNQNPNRSGQRPSNQQRPNNNQRKPSEQVRSSEGNRVAPSTQGKENTNKPNELHNKEHIVAQNKTSNNTLNDVLNFSNMDSKDILKGIILSEILGKPKALRKER